MGEYELATRMIHFDRIVFTTITDQSIYVVILLGVSKVSLKCQVVALDGSVSHWKKARRNVIWAGNKS
jgi:hypothetical protein